MIDDVIDVLNDQRASMGTLIKKIEDPQEITNPNIVKVVFDSEWFALYFSRAPIPFQRDEWRSIYEIQNLKSSPRRVACGDKIQNTQYAKFEIFSSISVSTVIEKKYSFHLQVWSKRNLRSKRNLNNYELSNME
jgi:hypothetical protein